MAGALSWPRMAPLVIFPNGIQQSDRAREEQAARVAESERLLTRVLSYDFTHEILGPEPPFGGVRDDEIMPTPDDVVLNNGGHEIYDLMGRNVPLYASLRDGRKDQALGLPMVWLPGVKGDRDSERARDQIEAAFENIDEIDISLRAACDAFERGWRPLENIWDVHARGAAAGLISIVAMIDRPNDWFGFDWRNRPRFKRSGNYRNPELIDDFKVSFMRCGSLHTRYGKGYGEDAYPHVYAIDAHMKAIARDAERFGYMPIVVTYPNTWTETSTNYVRLRTAISRQWKNFLLAPGDVDRPTYAWPSTDAAYAGANATGQVRMRAIEKSEAWLSSLIQGSQYSSGNQAEGSFARDQVASSDRLWKAPSDARCIEAMLNRCFVRPTMLVNNPLLEQSKWPRAAIDASFGEDLALMLQIFDQAAKLKIPISHVTWSERFNLPLAQPGEAVLEAPATGILAPPVDDPLAAAAEQFAEPDVITIKVGAREISMSPDQMVWTENRGMVRAKFLQTGDEPTFKAVAA